MPLPVGKTSIFLFFFFLGGLFTLSYSELTKVSEQ